MSTCSKNIIVTAMVTFVVTMLIVIIFMYFSKISGGSGGGSSDNVISGVWYHELDSSSDKKRVVVSIGQCTDEDGGYSSAEIEGDVYPMCGSMLVQGMDSKIVNGNEIYCADCYFRFTEGNGLEMYSKCIQNYANDFKGPLFTGWTYDNEKDVISTGSGDLMPVSSDIINVFSTTDDDGGDTNVCQRKKIGETCKDVCQDCIEIPCGKYSMCGTNDTCKCIKNDF